MDEDVRRTSTLVEDVHGSGVYPATGASPSGSAVVRSPAALGHPEMRTDRAAAGGGALDRLTLLAGRAIFGGYFVYNGINHFMNRAMMAGYARSKGVPAADAAVLGSGLLIVAGGLSVLTGVRPKTGAGLIAAFLLGVSPRMHAFWSETDEQQRMNEMINFTKNMALVGGSLFVAAHPEPWPWRLPLGTSRQEALVPVRG